MNNEVDLRYENLNKLISEYGEGSVKDTLSNFSCPINLDVERFLKEKAINSSKSLLTQTYLIFAQTTEMPKPVIVAYFSITNKTIIISDIKKPGTNLSKTMKKKISYLATYDRDYKIHTIAAPLIAQLGKNYNDNCHKFISGEQILRLALEQIKKVFATVGGKIVYVECEDLPKLKSFYEKNGFVVFQKRRIERDEEEFYKKDYLVQMVKYISQK